MRSKGFSGENLNNRKPTMSLMRESGLLSRQYPRVTNLSFWEKEQGSSNNQNNPQGNQEPFSVDTQRKGRTRDNNTSTILTLQNGFLQNYNPEVASENETTRKQANKPNS